MAGNTVWGWDTFSSEVYYDKDHMSELRIENRSERTSLSLPHFLVVDSNAEWHSDMSKCCSFFDVSKEAQKLGPAIDLFNNDIIRGKALWKQSFDHDLLFVDALLISSCSPLLCQYAVSLSSVLAIWDNSLRAYSNSQISVLCRE